MERAQWAAAAALPDPADSKFPHTEAMTLFACGIGAARSGDPAAAAKDVARLAAVVAARFPPMNHLWSTIRSACAATTAQRKPHSASAMLPRLEIISVVWSKWPIPTLPVPN